MTTRSISQPTSGPINSGRLKHCCDSPKQLDRIACFNVKWAALVTVLSEISILRLQIAVLTDQWCRCCEGWLRRQADALTSRRELNIHTGNVADSPRHRRHARPAGQVGRIEGRLTPWATCSQYLPGHCEEVREVVELRLVRYICEPDVPGLLSCNTPPLQHHAEDPCWVSFFCPIASSLLHVTSPNLRFRFTTRQDKLRIKIGQSLDGSQYLLRKTDIL